MVNGIIGKKLGMTQIFAADGTVTPVTVVKAGPCVVVQRKTAAGKDGYEAVQLGFVDDKAPKKVNKPMKGHYAKSNVKVARLLKEFRSFNGTPVQPGLEIKVDMFHQGDIVDVTGRSKGRGFQGVVKRHHFGGVGMTTHGASDRVRAPGSIGSSSFPSRVFKGMRMAGRMGAVGSAYLHAYAARRRQRSAAPARAARAGDQLRLPVSVRVHTVPAAQAAAAGDGGGGAEARGRLPELPGTLSPAASRRPARNGGNPFRFGACELDPAPSRAHARLLPRTQRR